MSERLRGAPRSSEAEGRQRPRRNRMPQDARVEQVLDCCAVTDSDCDPARARNESDPRQGSVIGPPAANEIDDRGQAAGETSRQRPNQFLATGRILHNRSVRMEKRAGQQQRAESAIQSCIDTACFLIKDSCEASFSLGPLDFCTSGKPPDDGEQRHALFGDSTRMNRETTAMSLADGLYRKIFHDSTSRRRNSVRSRKSRCRRPIDG